MPANPRPLEVYGLRVSVQDKRWWRRGQRLRVPYYNNYFFTTFWVGVDKVEQNDLGVHLILHFMFSDGTGTEILRIPPDVLNAIPVGVENKIRFSTDAHLLHPTGETSVVFNYVPQGSYVDNLFSFNVGKESTILGSIATGFVGLILLGSSLGGAVIGARCQPSPVNVIGPVAVVTATLEPTAPATQVPPTASLTP